MGDRPSLTGDKCKWGQTLINVNGDRPCFTGDRLSLKKGQT